MHEETVYEFAAYLAECYGCHRLLDLGYERVSSLVPLSTETGLAASGDHALGQHYAVQTCIPHDFERSAFKPPRRARASGSLLVCAGVMEHLVHSEHLLATLRSLLEDAPVAILTTRLRPRGVEDMEPPADSSGLRDWNQRPSGSCTCMGGSSTRGNGGTAVPSGHVQSLTSRISSSQEAASGCSRAIWQSPSSFLSASSLVNCRASLPAAGLRYENTVLRHVNRPVVQIADTKRETRLSTPNGDPAVQAWATVGSIQERHNNSTPGIARGPRSPPLSACHPRALVLRQGRHRPDLCHIRLQPPSNSLFSVPDWKPHSISTSIRFHVPMFGPTTRMAGTGGLTPDFSSVAEHRDHFRSRRDAGAISRVHFLGRIAFVNPRAPIH